MGDKGDNITALPPGYKLHWYVIESILGQGGFGITYLAQDTNLDTQVAIKEFFPTELTARTQDSAVNAASTRVVDSYEWGLSRFLAEAKTLAQLRHPNIVSVYSVFEENKTAYMVMEYLQGQEFSKYFRGREQKDEAVLRRVLLDLLDGLRLIHDAGYIHRDIKPPNILIRGDVSPILLDFGSARQAVGDQTHLTSLVTPGYAPFEQYSDDTDEDGEKQGPWTDIYSAAATMYFAVAGRGPIDAIKRVEALVAGRKDPMIPAVDVGEGKYSTEFLEAIDWGLRFRANERPQSIDEWLTLIEVGEVATRRATGKPVPPAARSGSVEADDDDASEAPTEVHQKTIDLADTEAPTQVNLPPEQAPATSKKSFVVPASIGAVVVLVVAAAAVVFLGQQEEPAQTPVVGTTTSPPVDDASAKQDNVQLEITELLTAAEADIDAGRFTEPPGNNALDRLRAVLALESGNDSAIAGITRIVAELTTLADSSLSAGRLDEAESYIASATAIDGEAPALQGLTQRLDEARRKADSAAQAKDEQQKRQDELRALLVSADQHLSEGRLDAPVGKNALEAYQSVLIQEPGNELALAGIAKVIGSLTGLAETSLSKQEFDKAEAYLARVFKIDAQAPEAQALDKKITTARDKADQREAERAKLKAEIKRLLSEAETEFSAGRLDTPSGRNALERYRDVLALDKSNTKARDGIARIVVTLSTLADKASSEGRFDEAEGILDRVERIDPGSSALKLSRRQLAQRREEHARKQQAAAAAAAAAAPKNLAGSAIFGRWCSSAVNLEFSEREMQFQLENGVVHAYSIERYDFGENLIAIFWADNEQKAMVTEFGKFAASGASMVQLRGKHVADSNWRDYNRTFKRCG